MNFLEKIKKCYKLCDSFNIIVIIIIIIIIIIIMSVERAQ